MTTKKSYNRFFIIFQEEDKGYGVAIDKQPTGYAKIEVKSGKCKITVYAQNLKGEKGPYFFYMIDTAKTPVLLIKLGEVKIDEAGKGETWWEYNEENIADSKCSADKFNMASIIVPGESIIAPLAGYTGKDKINWREKILIENKQDEVNTEVLPEDTRAAEEDASNIESITETLDEEGLKFKEYEDKIRGENELVEAITDEESEAVKLETRDLRLDEDKPEEPAEDENSAVVESELREIKSEEPVEEKAELEDNRDNNRDNNEDTPDNSFDSELIRHDSHKEHKDYKNKHKGYKSHAAIFHQMLANFDEDKDIFDEEENDDCRWWKIPYNCSFPIMENKYYPFLCTIYHLKMTYPNIDYIKYFYKKGYYYFGIKYDKNNEVKYIMYGIEGANTMKEQPYMGMTGFGKWKKLMGKNSGMWIMFYNPRTGNIMVERNE